MKKTRLAERLLYCMALAVCVAPSTLRAQVTPSCKSPAGAYFGGPILSQVEIVPVFWNSSVNSQLTAPTTGIAQFYADVTQSSYWTWLKEYSTPSQTIAPGSAYAGITIIPAKCPSSSSCTVSDAQVQTELMRQVGLGILPAPTSNTVYMISFPPNVTLDGPDGAGRSCVDFCAYHNSFISGSTVYIYACLMDQFTAACSSGCGIDPTAMNNSTDTASHELIEAVTDPDVGLDVQADYAYPCGWADNNNYCGELADICDSGEGDTITVSGRTWYVQEIWSDCQAKCVSKGSPGPYLVNQNASTYENSAVAVTVSSYSGCLAMGHVYTVTANPAHGALSGSAPNFTYTPTSGYAGVDSFRYLDTGIGVFTNGAVAPVTVNITVQPIGPFSITSSSLDSTGTNFIVCWQSVPGIAYTVLTNTSLTKPASSWAAAGSPITASSATTCFTLPGGVRGRPDAFVVIKQ